MMEEALLPDRVLLVEDDYFLASDLAARLSSKGIQVIGPVPDVDEALSRSLDDTLSGAILDIKLNGQMVFPVADELERRGVPFIFATGYDPDVIPARHADKILLRKPLDEDAVASALRRSMQGDGIARKEARENRILNKLDDRELDLVLPLLRKVHVPRGAILEMPRQTISRLYFPIDCVVSLILVGRKGSRIETGLIGREGMTSFGIVEGYLNTSFELVSQLDGTCLAIAAGDFAGLLEHVPSLRRFSSRFARTLNLQVSYTALANGKFGVAQRLARWLLMIQDRVSDRRLTLTHDYLALMLGVRRSSVTDTLHVLEGERLIRATRSQIEIIDRDGLMRFAGEIYGEPETEYQRLMSEEFPTGLPQ